MGQIIRKHRKEYRMINQEQLGAKVGLGVNSVSQIEKGSRLVYVHHLQAICEALSLSADYLLWSQGEDHP